MKHNFVVFCVNICDINCINCKWNLIKRTTWGARLSSSAESQKGVNAVQWCSVENQKGALAIGFIHTDNAPLTLNGTSLNSVNALLALNWRVGVIHCSFHTFSRTAFPPEGLQLCDWPIRSIQSEFTVFTYCNNAGPTITLHVWHVWCS